MKNYLKLPALGLLLLFSSCMRDMLGDTDPAGGINDGRLTFTIHVPGSSIPATRTIPEGGDKDNEIKDLAFLLFDAADETYKGCVLPNTIDEVMTGGETPTVDYTKKEVTVTIPDGAYKVVVMANLICNKKYDAEELTEPGFFSGTLTEWLTEFEVHLDGYNFDVDGMGEFSGVYNTDTDDGNYRPFYMGGFVDIPATGRTSKSIGLVRHTAKIDVNASAVKSAFTLTDVAVMNTAQVTYITPSRAWESGVPSLFAAASMNAGAMDYTQFMGAAYGAAKVDKATNSMTDEIFVFETPVPTGTDAWKKAPSVVVGGMVGTEKRWFRVDLRLPNPDHGDALEYVNIVRNFKYTVLVKAIKGNGYGSFKEAWENMAEGISVEIEAIDESGMNDVVYNGSYQLATDTSAVEIGGVVDDTAPLRVYTDFSGGWKVADVSAGWLTVSPDSRSTANTKGVSEEVILTATGTNPSKTETRTATITLTAGNLKKTVTVTQKEKPYIAPLFARSNIVIVDGKPTFAVTAEDNETIPANSMGVYFKWGSLVAAGNYDTDNAIAVFPPDEMTAKPATWGEISYSDSSLPLSGYDSEAGTGDICAYISDRPGWTKGRWRTPTRDDWGELIKEGMTVSPGSWSNVKPLASDEPTVNNYGFCNKYQGRSYGGGNAPGDESGNTGDNYMEIPADGTVFLPASGYRNSSSGGEFFSTGEGGFYWSSVLYYVNNAGIDFSFTGTTYNLGYSFRTFGHTVRCIRDTSKPWPISADISGNAISGGTITAPGSAFAGAKVTISAPPAATGNYFIGWTSTPEVTFDDAGSRNTTFTMPAAAVTITAKYSNKIAPLFARSNIVYKDGQLTFATSVADNATIPANSQGVFFKWGSLVGVGNYGTDTSITLFPPAGMPTPPTSWDTVSYSLAATTLSDYDLTTGTGDVCKYISSQPGWAKGSWRIPTDTEWGFLTGENATKNGGFGWQTASATDNDGSLEILSGYFFGGTTVGSQGVPTDGIVFLPASGGRLYGSTGTLVKTGDSGYYRSSVPFSYDAFSLYFASGSFRADYTGSSRNGGHSVRCIRDTE